MGKDMFVEPLLQPSESLIHVLNFSLMKKKTLTAQLFLCFQEWT
jgi:hypothetical protein